MNTRRLSPTYIHILDLIQRLKTQKVDDTTQVQEGNKLIIAKSGTKSDRVIQEITIANDELWEKCTSAEWYLLGRIGRELKYGNVLWHCGVNHVTGKPLKSSSSIKKTIASLTRKQLLVTTETTDIYLVNPFYLRKGDLTRIIHGMAEHLMDCPKITIDYIKPVFKNKGLDLSDDMKFLTEQVN